MLETLNEKSSKLIESLIAYAPKLVGAIVVLIIGLWIIKKLMNVVGKYMNKSGMDKDIQPFLKSILGVLLKVMLLLSVAGIIGIETTSFVALIAAAGFAIGMALQGSLANFASGVMILIFKPYSVGDLIDIQDQVGHVEEIQIFNTVMTSLDNKRVIIPNAQAISGTITNLSAKEFLRVDLNVFMPYEENFDRVKGIVEEAMRNTPKVLQSPAPYCQIEAFDGHNIKLAARPHATCEDYWDVYFGAYQNIKAALGAAGVKINYAEGMTTGQISA